MVERSLSGLRVAILATDGFEQPELTEPHRALEEAGASAEVVAPKRGKIRGWNHREWADPVNVDRLLDEASAAHYDALMLPGGVMNSDTLRMQPKAVAFVRHFFDEGKPVAAICHAAWTVVESGAARGYRMTSWPSLRTDIVNAGGEWVDEEVVVDDNLVTSRKPDDLPVFNRAMILTFAGRVSAERPRTSDLPAA